MCAHLLFKLFRIFFIVIHYMFSYFVFSEIDAWFKYILIVIIDIY